MALIDRLDQDWYYKNNFKYQAIQADDLRMTCSGFIVTIFSYILVFETPRKAFDYFYEVCDMRLSFQAQKMKKRKLKKLIKKIPKMSRDELTELLEIIDKAIEEKKESSRLRGH